MHVSFERSGKWPDSLPVVLRMKTAFYLAMKKQLKHEKHCVHAVRAFKDCLWVAKVGESLIRFFDIGEYRYQLNHF